MDALESLLKIWEVHRMIFVVCWCTIWKRPKEDCKDLSRIRISLFTFWSVTFFTNKLTNQIIILFFLYTESVNVRWHHWKLHGCRCKYDFLLFRELYREMAKNYFNICKCPAMTFLHVLSAQEYEKPFLTFSHHLKSGDRLHQGEELIKFWAKPVQSCTGYNTSILQWSFLIFYIYEWIIEVMNELINQIHSLI